jgi:hypothetical protein
MLVWRRELTDWSMFVRVILELSAAGGIGI